jgi:signal transduction histidine kinase
VAEGGRSSPEVGKLRLPGQHDQIGRFRVSIHPRQLKPVGEYLLAFCHGSFRWADGATMRKPDTATPTLAPDHDPPVVVAFLPATRRQRSIALGVVLSLLVVAVLLAPFANVQLGRVDGFVPVVQTVLSVADLLTATLLFAQYSVQHHRALLAVAGGYLFSASFAFLQTLSFPGGYAPNGIIGDGFNTPAWLFVLWHVTFPLSLVTYALLKDREETSAASTTRAIVITLACVFGVTAALSLLVTVWIQYLPPFYSTNITALLPLGNQVNAGLFFLGALTLVILFIGGRTVLDLWLMVTMFAWLPNFVVGAVASASRFSVGWYATRGFALVASCMLLAVLLTEMTVLYSRLGSALTMLRRERTNRLVSIDAAIGAIAHEIRSPLGSITLNASTARLQVLAQPPQLEEVPAILTEIEDASLRVDTIVASVRGVFKHAAGQPMTVSVEDVVQQVLRLLRHELQFNEVTVVNDFTPDLPPVRIDPTQLQQVILNLIKNAIEAMRFAPHDRRRLQVSTRRGGSSSVLLSFQDTGSGVDPQDRDRIFEPFFTTKPDGTGLGLAICRSIVEGFEGSLALARSSDQGSMFEIALPTAPVGEAR